MILDRDQIYITNKLIFIFVWNQSEKAKLMDGITLFRKYEILFNFSNTDSSIKQEAVSDQS